MSKAREQPSYEEAIQQLEAILEQAESGELGLEESLAQFERATKLLAKCQTILDKAQARIAKLTADGKGGLRVESPRGDEQDAAPAGEDVDEGDLAPPP